MPRRQERDAGGGETMRLVFLISYVIGMLATATADADVIGVYKDWTAVTSTSGARKTCMMWSQPKQSQGFKDKRGDVFAFVTHQPSANRFDRVSFETGYTLDSAPSVRVSIGDEHFQLSASGSGAWARNSADDAALIKAMRAGRTMTVEGKASGAATVRDTYSLIGFTAAYNAITAACKVR